jgi:uncharacterized protein (TIGR02569 family)
MGVRPDEQVVKAFGGSPAELVPLAGGQGGSWRAGGIALKPAEGAESLDWLGGLLDRVPDSPAFRLARPVRSVDGGWVVDGWSATTWVDGEHQPGRWEERLAVSRALHAALGGLGGLGATLPWVGCDPWSVGMRVAWGWQALDASRHRAAVPLYESLSPLLHEPWNGVPPQVIHGDLCGNIVFATGEPPAVIDFSAHWAPAPFADAIIVADGVAWEDAPVELAVRFAAAEPQGRQLLARAVVYRVVCMAHLVPDLPDRVRTEQAGYQQVIDLLLR